MKGRKAVLLALAGSALVAAISLLLFVQRGTVGSSSRKTETTTCSILDALPAVQSAPQDMATAVRPLIEKPPAPLTPENLESLLGGTPVEILQTYVSSRSNREETLRNAGFFESWEWKDPEGVKKFKKLTLDALQPLIQEFEKTPWPVDKEGEEETLYYRSSLTVRLPDTDAHWLIVAEVRVWNGKKIFWPFCVKTRKRS